MYVFLIRPRVTYRYIQTLPTHIACNAFHLAHTHVPQKITASIDDSHTSISPTLS
jgi:hypothetical protein